MPIIHSINQQYTGGGTSGIGGSKAYTGNSEFNFDAAVPTGTVTLAPLLNLDPDNQILSYCFSASGNCTLQFTSGSDTVSINLPANAPVIVGEAGGVITGVPTATATYTVRLLNATAASTITVNGRMLIE